MLCYCVVVAVAQAAVFLLVCSCFLSGFQHLAPGRFCGCPCSHCALLSFQEFQHHQLGVCHRLWFLFWWQRSPSISVSAHVCVSVAKLLQYLMAALQPLEVVSCCCGCFVCVTGCCSGCERHHISLRNVSPCNGPGLFLLVSRG